MIKPDRIRWPFGLNNIFYGWWIVCACFFISLYVGCIGFYGFTAFFEPLVKEFGWSFTQVSFASSLRGIEMSFLAPLIGFLVDRFGSRKMAFSGVTSIGLGFILLSCTQSLWMFYVSSILIGFGGGGCTSVVLSRVVADWFRRDVGKALGIMASGFGASGLLVPVVVWLIDASGWRTAMIILGAGMLVIGIPLTLVIRNTPEACGLYPDGRPPDPPTAANPGTAKGERQEIGLWDAMKDRAFLGLAMSEALRMTSLSAMITHIMPYLGLLRVERTTAGLIAGAIPVLSIAGRFGFGWLGDRFDKRLLIATAYGLTSLGILILCFAEEPWAMLLFLTLCPLGFGGAMVLRAAILREYFGRETFGRLFGFIAGAAGVGGVIGPTLAGLIYDIWKSYGITWVGLSVGSASAVFLMLAVGPRKERA